MSCGRSPTGGAALGTMVGHASFDGILRPFQLYLGLGAKASNSVGSQPSLAFRDSSYLPGAGLYSGMRITLICYKA